MSPVLLCMIALTFWPAWSGWLRPNTWPNSCVATRRKSINVPPLAAPLSGPEYELNENAVLKITSPSVLVEPRDQLVATARVEEPKALP